MSCRPIVADRPLWELLAALIDAEGHQGAAMDAKAGASQQVHARTPVQERQPAFDTADENMVVAETPDFDLAFDPFAEDIGDDQTQLDLEQSSTAAADVTPTAAIPSSSDRQQCKMQQGSQQARSSQPAQHSDAAVTAAAATGSADHNAVGSVNGGQQHMDHKGAQSAQQGCERHSRQQRPHQHQPLSPWHQQHQQQQRKAAQRAAAITAAVAAGTHQQHDESEDNFYDADDHGDGDFDPKCETGAVPGKHVVTPHRTVPRTPPSINHTPVALDGVQRKLTEFFSPTKHQQQHVAESPTASAGAANAERENIDALGGRHSPAGGAQQPCQQRQQHQQRVQQPRHQQQQQQQQQDPQEPVQQQQCVPGQRPSKQLLLRPTAGRVRPPVSIDLTGTSSGSEGEGEPPSVAKPKRSERQQLRQQQERPHVSSNDCKVQLLPGDSGGEQHAVLVNLEVKQASSSSDSGDSCDKQDKEQQRQQLGSVLPGIQLQQPVRKRSLSLIRRPARSGSQPPQHPSASPQQQQQQQQLLLQQPLGVLQEAQSQEQQQGPHNQQQRNGQIDAAAATVAQQHAANDAAAQASSGQQQQQCRKRGAEGSAAGLQGKRQRSTSASDVSAAVAAAAGTAAWNHGAQHNAQQQQQPPPQQQHEEQAAIEIPPQRFFTSASSKHTHTAAAGAPGAGDKNEGIRNGKKAKNLQQKGSAAGKRSKESSLDVGGPATAAATEAAACAAAAAAAGGDDSVAAAAAAGARAPADIQLLDKNGLLTWPEMPAGGDWLPPTWHTASTLQLMTRRLDDKASASQETLDSQFATPQQQQQQQQQRSPPARRGRGRARGSGRKLSAVQHVSQDTCDAEFVPAQAAAAAAGGASAAVTAAAGSQVSDSIADDLGLEMCEEEQYEQWASAPCQAIYYVFRDDQGPFFRPFKPEYQALFSDPDKRGPQTAEQVLLAQADPCHPCNWCPLGSHLSDEQVATQAQLDVQLQLQQLPAAQVQEQPCPPTTTAAQVSQQRPNLARMLLAAVDLPAKAFLGSYMPRDDALLLQSESNAVTSADLSYVAAVEAYELECAWTEVDGDHIEMLASPTSCLLSLINDSTCWQHDMEELGRRCPRKALGSCTCHKYVGRQPNVVLLHCVYKALDGTAVPAPMFFTSRPVPQHAELLCCYEYLQGHSGGRQVGEPTYWPVQIANSQQLEVLQLRLLGAQVGLQHMMYQLRQSLPARFAQTLNALAPVISAAADGSTTPAAPAAVRAALAAEAAGQLQQDARQLQASLTVALHASRREAGIKAQSLIDAVLGAARVSDWQQVSSDGPATAVATAVQTGRRSTRSMAEQLKAQQQQKARLEQRRLLRSDPVKAVRQAVARIAAEQHVKLCGDLLPGFWHSSFKTLDKQLQQQDKQEQQAKQGLQQLEVLLLQLQQQLQLYEQCKQAALTTPEVQQQQPGATAIDHLSGRNDGEVKSSSHDMQYEGNLDVVAMDIEPAAALTVAASATATTAAAAGVAAATSSMPSSERAATLSELEAVKQEQQRQAALLRAMQQQIDALQAGA